MDYIAYYLRLCRDYYRDPFPHFSHKHQGVLGFSVKLLWWRAYDEA